VTRRILGLALMAGGVLSLTESAARAQAMHALLPAPEVAAIVRSQGFEPISPLMRRGNSYVLRAAGPDGRELRVVVAARSGDIISATPVVPAGPAGDRLGAFERMDGPPPPIVHEGDRPMRRPMATIPNPPPRIARGPAPEMQDLPPMGPQAEPPVIMREERGEHGLLPPPPERHMPRAAAPGYPAPKPVAKPAAKPAPAKRVAATPLPKPRPNPDGENQAGEVKRWGEEPAKPEVAAEPQPSPAAPKPSVAPMSEDKVDARQLPN
jgi:hypothetical protein